MKAYTVLGALPSQEAGDIIAKGLKNFFSNPDWDTEFNVEVHFGLFHVVAITPEKTTNPQMARWTLFAQGFASGYFAPHPAPKPIEEHPLPEKVGLWTLNKKSLTYVAEMSELEHNGDVREVDNATQVKVTNGHWFYLTDFKAEMAFDDISGWRHTNPYTGISHLVIND